MLEKIRKYNIDNQLFSNEDNLLVAVSGGLDSMVLLHSLYKLNLNIAAAHCNFQLRGKDSDEDLAFVRDWCRVRSIPFYSIAFDTEEYAQETKKSIQIAARDLRYEWFESIRTQNHFDYIVTAHHLNDSIETLFYNLIQGGGIRALHGIPNKNGHIIRPLLSVTREEIEFYAKENDISWREDSSNDAKKYARNKIRHDLIPIAKVLNPGLESSLGDSIEIYKEVEKLYDFAISTIERSIVTEEGDLIKIEIGKLLKCPSPTSFLFEYLRKYQFNKHQCRDILEASKGQPGKVFETSEKQLLVDRDFLILSNQENFGKVKYNIELGKKKAFFLSYEILLEEMSLPPKDFGVDPYVAYFDRDKMEFPLTIRTWKNGDRFQPFGMKGKSQKLQDFYNNNKLTLIEKNKTLILESGGSICWIIGRRTDERFRVSKQTNTILRISFQKI